MITRDLAIALGERWAATLYHKTLKNADGTAVRARVNGKCKVWKKRPDTFRLPVKHGLRQCFYIDPDNADEWTEVEPV